MAILIHVAVSLDKADVVETELKRCCADIGDEVLGKRIYDEVEEVLFVVRLYQDNHLSQHIKVLNQYLQSQQLLSFQFEHTNLIRVQGNPIESGIRSAMIEFPLQPNESWFPSITEPQMLYLCTRNILIKPEQAQWLTSHQAAYQYL